MAVASAWRLTTTDCFLEFLWFILRFFLELIWIFTKFTKCIVLKLYFHIEGKDMFLHNFFLSKIISLHSFIKFIYIYIFFLNYFRKRLFWMFSNYYFGDFCHSNWSFLHLLSIKNITYNIRVHFIYIFLF